MTTVSLLMMDELGRGTGSISSAVPPHLRLRGALKCLASLGSRLQVHGEQERRENEAGCNTARPPLSSDTASSALSVPAFSLTCTHRLTHISGTHRAPGKRQVGAHWPSQTEELPPPPSTFLPKLPQLWDQKQGLAHTPGLGLKCCSHSTGPRTQHATVDHDMEAWKPPQVQGLRSRLASRDRTQGRATVTGLDLQGSFLEREEQREQTGLWAKRKEMGLEK